MVLRCCSEPPDAIAAATHPDPYPYYARLVRETPVTFDPVHRLWVVASAATVIEVLTHPLCRVRPADEPVPRDVAGGPLGNVYRRFARTTDGDAHTAHRAPVAAALESVAIPRVEAVAAECARSVIGAITWKPDGAGITQAAFDIPVRTMAALLDIPAPILTAATNATQAVVRGLRPFASGADQSAGHEGVRRLLGVFATMVGAGQGASSVLGVLQRASKHRGLDANAAAAAAIGMLVQTCEATAGLIGNTLVWLGRHPTAYGAVRSDPDSLADVVVEVLRFDPPVQNTRRYLAAPAAIAGIEMDQGAGILVLLAAANRDPAVNPAPNSFDCARQAGRLFTFGVGGHTCPGRQLAETITACAVDVLLSAGVDVHRLVQDFSYLPSVNTRIPLFAHGSRE